MSTYLIGGIEGGATHSYAVILNSAGQIIGNAKGPGTNHIFTGMDECRKRIAHLISKSKLNAGLPETQPLDALGLSLSGCKLEKTNQVLLEGLKRAYPNLSEKYVISGDIDGSMAAISNKGGVTCIAGTGSNTVLINPDGSRVQCRAWGYFLAGEGSAWKIAQRAVKYCFDDLDNFDKSPYPIDAVWDLIRKHFNIDCPADLLPMFYVNFDKAYIASLSKKLSDLARNGDELCQAIFSEAGRHLAKSISAVSQKAAKQLTQRDGGIHIFCVGSVWLSWDLLKSGFISLINEESNIQELSLMRLTTEMGVGAAYMASDKLSLPLARDYSKNYVVFYVYNRSEYSESDSGV